MDFSSLFSVSDNLYKFLFVGGIVMICFSMIYPLQQQHAIELEINAYNQEAEILNNDIAVLQKLVGSSKKLSTESWNALNALKKIEKSQPEQYERNVIKVKESYNSNFRLLKKKELEVKVKNIILKYNKSKIELLQKHSRSYNAYSWFLIIFGSVSFFFGLVLWSRSTNRTERIKKEEIKKLKKSE